ncbi:MAG TPA: HsdR family type I site-specific deoxyribonuclease, partial [Candidatus Hodarchaeales archaeon]|nr:HsdR family type I site-specific deoxyribonuclease [Candidatus Hodarchaeales archaeon]
KLLRDGVGVPVPKEHGAAENELIRFIDLDNPANNDFLCVSQLWIVGEYGIKRPDVVLFVNGIPLILMELKAAHISLVDAYRDNLRDYKDKIPKLFWYNMGIIISNGIDNKFVSLTSPFEFFNDWKKAEKEEEEPKTDLATMIRGVCDKGRMLDIFENYILFDESKGETRKVVPRYFQYYGVNKAFQKVIDRKKNKGKLGVFWHTQGSGKSYSMVYLSQKVLRKLTGNFTFVIVTDRKDLDKQAYDNFAYVGSVYEKEVRADSITHLKELLGQDHRQIFTTIQKFQDIDGALSDRDDIIVMTDEAHRTQYDRMAQNMRKALPNAAFIGFTGTPLMAKGEEKTRETFGDYVSVYNFGQSVIDKATV